MNLLIVLRPLLPKTRASSFRSSIESISFCLASPQYSFATTLTYKIQSHKDKKNIYMGNLEN